MEEQTADIEVTVKTLDSQSRTYTVGAQVSYSVPVANSGMKSRFLSVIAEVWLKCVCTMFL